jgi:hypothetical protein
VLKQHNPYNDQAEKRKRTVGSQQNNIDGDWLNKEEEDFGYQNLTKKKFHNKLKRMVQVKRSGVKRNLDPIISFLDSNPQYNKYYLMLREMRQDVVKE